MGKVSKKTTYPSDLQRETKISIKRPRSTNGVVILKGHEQISVRTENSLVAHAQRLISRNRSSEGNFVSP